MRKNDREDIKVLGKEYETPVIQKIAYEALKKALSCGYKVDDLQMAIDVVVEARRKEEEYIEICNPYVVEVVKVSQQLRSLNFPMYMIVHDENDRGKFYLQEPSILTRGAVDGLVCLRSDLPDEYLEFAIAKEVRLASLTPVKASVSFSRIKRK